MPRILELAKVYKKLRKVAKQSKGDLLLRVGPFSMSQKCKLILSNAEFLININIYHKL
jgi:hypothetical protein